MNGLSPRPSSIPLDSSCSSCCNTNKDLPLVRPRNTTPLNNVQNIPIDFSFPSQSTPMIDSTRIDPSSPFSEHIQKMKMIQLSSSSLSDFITPRFHLKNFYPCTRVSLTVHTLSSISFSISRRHTSHASLSRRLFVQSA